MEPFKIKLAAQILTVKPRLDNAFEIYEHDKKLGTILPILIDNATKWTSKELNENYAQQIGELIDKHNR